MCLVSCASDPAGTSYTGYSWPSLPRPDFLPPPGPQSGWRQAWRGSSPGLPTPGTLPGTILALELELELELVIGQFQAPSHAKMQ